MFYVVVRLVSWSAQPMRVCGVVYDGGRFAREAVSGRESTLPSLYTLRRRLSIWRAHKLRRSVVSLQKRMHDSAATGANCDPVAAHPTPSRGPSPSRPRPMPGPGPCCVPGFACVDQPTPRTLVAHLKVIDNLPHLTSNPWWSLSHLKTNPATCHNG